MKYTGKLYGKIGRRYVLLKTTSEEVDELEQRHSEICARLQECVQKHHIGLGGEKLDQLVCDHIETQAAEIKGMREAIKEAYATISSLRAAAPHPHPKEHPSLFRASQEAEAALAKLQPFITAPEDQFLIECAKHCHCDHDLCDSVLAGAPCEGRMRDVLDYEE